MDRSSAISVSASTIASETRGPELSPPAVRDVFEADRARRKELLGMLRTPEQNRPSIAQVSGPWSASNP